MATSSVDVFKRFVPEQAVDYCNGLYSRLGFEFKIKKGRSTKLGDFRFDSLKDKTTITINNDLNQYAFLVTYLHEVAHLMTFRKYGNEVNPHGEEWKVAFVALVKPVLNKQVFPDPILSALQRYFKNPKASSCSDPKLFQALRLFDPPSDKVMLEKVPVDLPFQFNKRVYRKLQKRRTRWICQEESTRRKYLIPAMAEVRIVDNKG